MVKLQHIKERTHRFSQRGGSNNKKIEMPVLAQRLKHMVNGFSQRRLPKGFVK